jgi:hypothetical protein
VRLEDLIKDEAGGRIYTGGSGRRKLQPARGPVPGSGWRVVGYEGSLSSQLAGGSGLSALQPQAATRLVFR